VYETRCPILHFNLTFLIARFFVFCLYMTGRKECFVFCKNILKKSSPD